MTDKVSSVFNDWARAGRAEGMEQSHGRTVVPFLHSLSLNQPFSFLDFGCGNGWVVRMLAQHPKCQEAWGLDGSQDMIVRAKEQSVLEKENYVCGDVMLWDPRKTFDLIFSMEALYYSVPMEPTLAKLVGFLSPSAQLIVGTNYYEENPKCHSWPKDLDVPMDLRSMAGWKEMFETAGLKAVRQIQVQGPSTEKEAHEIEVHGKGQEGSLGTLFTMGVFADRS